MAIPRVNIQWELLVHDCIYGQFVSGHPSKDDSTIGYMPTIFREMMKRGNAHKSDPVTVERRGLQKGD